MRLTLALSALQSYCGVENEMMKNRIQYVSKRHSHSYSCSGLTSRPWGWGEDHWVLRARALTLRGLSSPEDIKPKRCLAPSFPSHHWREWLSDSVDFQPHICVTQCRVPVNMFLTLFNSGNALPLTCCFHSVVLVFAIPFTFLIFLCLGRKMTGYFPSERVSVILTVVVIETSAGQYCVSDTQKIILLSQLPLSWKHLSYVSRGGLCFPTLLT